MTTTYRQQSLFMAFEPQLPQSSWKAADDVADAVNAVAWRSRFREPVFAERAARAGEAWIAGQEQREMDVLLHSRVGRMSEELKSCRDSLRLQLWSLNRLLDGATATRPPRRMPSLKRIADYHQLESAPMCVRCGWYPPVDTWREASGYLERAHIIDRCYDGLDSVANLAPLCDPCHRSQPIFEPGDEGDALEWFGLLGARRDEVPAA